MVTQYCLILCQFVSIYICPLCVSSHSHALDSWFYKWKKRLLKVHNSYSWSWENGWRVILWLASPHLCDRSCINYNVLGSRRYDNLYGYRWNTILTIKKKKKREEGKKLQHLEELKTLGFCFKNRVQTGSDRTNESPRRISVSVFSAEKCFCKIDSHLTFEYKSVVGKVYSWN